MISCGLSVLLVNRLIGSVWIGGIITLCITLGTTLASIWLIKERIRSHYEPLWSNLVDTLNSKLGVKINTRLMDFYSHTDWKSRVQNFQSELSDYIEEHNFQLSRYQVAMEAANDGVFDFDIQKDSCFLSPAACRILGYDRFEMDLDTLASMIHIRDIKPAQEALQKYLEDKSDSIELRLEFRIMKKSRNYTWVVVKGRAIRSEESGSPIRIIGVFHDVSERKSVEREINMLNQQLGRSLNEERLKNEFNSKLATVGQLAAGVAHEINNPLAIVMGAASVVGKLHERDRLSDEKLQKYLGTIEQAVQRAAVVTDNLLKISRASTESKITKVAIHSLLAELISLFQEQLSRDRVSVEVVCSSDEFIDVDYQQISQAFLAILTNALEAVDRSQDKWIRILVHRESEEYYIQFIDSGPGISEEYKSRIFDPFFSTKPIGDGSGLSLSLAQRILDNHGGEIFIDSSVDHTCFTVRMPIAGAVSESLAS